MTPPMPPESRAGVVVAHADDRMRRMLRRALEEAGHAVVEAPRYDDALRRLCAADGPAVVVAGNVSVDYIAEADFFRRVAADPALAGRHRFVLLATIPDYLPPSLDATLRTLGVPILAAPLHLHELYAAVAVVAGRACATRGGPHIPGARRAPMERAAAGSAGAPRPCFRPRAQRGAARALEDGRTRRAAVE